MTDTQVMPLRAFAEVTLGRMRTPDQAEGPHMVRYLRAANVLDGQLDLSDVKEMNFSPGEQLTYALRAGDVLISEGSGSLATVGANAVWNGEVDGVVCFQNTLLRLRPRENADARYLAWWCRHAFGSGLFASIATGANIYHLSGERLRSLPLRAPNKSTQRAIADFLDRETARIDAIIVRKRLLTSNLDARCEAAIDSSFADLLGSATVSPTSRLGRQVLSITDGPFGSRLTSAHYSVEGARVVRLANIGRAEFVNEDQAWIPRDYFDELRSHEVVAGDLLMAGLGDEGHPVGRACIAPTGLEPAIVKADCFRIRLDQTTLLHEFAAWFFSSGVGSRLTATRIRGATRDRINTSVARELELPVPSLAEQRRVVDHCVRSRNNSRRPSGLVAGQIALLIEHKHALITAAVSGQIEVAA